MCSAVTACKAPYEGTASAERRRRRRRLQRRPGRNGTTRLHHAAACILPVGQCHVHTAGSAAARATRDTALAGDGEARCGRRRRRHRLQPGQRCCRQGSHNASVRAGCLPLQSSVHTSGFVRSRQRHVRNSVSRARNSKARAACSTWRSWPALITARGGLGKTMSTSAYLLPSTCCRALSASPLSLAPLRPRAPPLSALPAHRERRSPSERSQNGRPGLRVP